MAGGDVHMCINCICKERWGGAGRGEQRPPLSAPRESESMALRLWKARHREVGGGDRGHPARLWLYGCGKRCRACRIPHRRHAAGGDGRSGRQSAEPTRGPRSLLAAKSTRGRPASVSRCKLQLAARRRRDQDDSDPGMPGISGRLGAPRPGASWS